MQLEEAKANNQEANPYLLLLKKCDARRQELKCHPPPTPAPPAGNPDGKPQDELWGSGGAEGEDQEMAEADVAALQAEQDKLEQEKVAMETQLNTLLAQDTPPPTEAEAYKAQCEAALDAFDKAKKAADNHRDNSLRVRKKGKQPAKTQGAEKKAKVGEQSRGSGG